MVRGDKLNSAEAGAPTDENEEIDRIMKEIEDLEKKMDTSPEAPESPEVPESPQAATETVTETEQDSTPTAKVVSLRPTQHSESLAETDAVPVTDEPMVRSGGASPGDSGLSMKIGGCTEVALEFTSAGITVSLSCSEEGLCITTDQGAEFKIPFKRGA